MNYDEFLHAKVAQATSHGFEVDPASSTRS
jgi:hypothetical protein